MRSICLCEVKTSFFLVGNDFIRLDKSQQNCMFFFNNFLQKTFGKDQFQKQNNERT